MGWSSKRHESYDQTKAQILSALLSEAKGTGPSQPDTRTATEAERLAHESTPNTEKSLSKGPTETRNIDDASRSIALGPSQEEHYVGKLLERIAVMETKTTDYVDFCKTADEKFVRRDELKLGWKIFVAAFTPVLAIIGTLTWLIEKDVLRFGAGG
ncbi:MAG: hypothetical protein NXI21_00215 [Alphaproteobacteria bacterium]|nr:hypothetical protein [Alphaproteobacteria bacterium]